ncbi:MAG: RNA polymerase sigma factor [Planctomycetota bacterium]
MYRRDYDEELIKLANKGGTDAFETLYYRYRDWVYQLAWRFTGDQDKALDVLQETFIYLLKKLPNLKLTARMTTFLYPVVKHLSLTTYRSNKHLVHAEESLKDLPSTANKKINGVRVELAAALAVLPEEQREVILMRFVDDMKMKEIALTLNIPIGTIKSRLHNALQALRRDRRTKDYFLE